MTKRRFIGRILAGIFLILAIAAMWLLGPALLPSKPIEVGIALDAKAPISLELRDHKGQTTSLAAQMGDKGMVLYLVRSADWCPFCKAQLVRTKDIAPQVASAGYTLVSVSYDEPPLLEAFKVEQSIGFTLLSDKGSRLIDALGLRDPEYPLGHMAYGVPRASILILAPDGSVKAKYVSQDYRSRPANEVVLDMIAKAD